MSIEHFPQRFLDDLDTVDPESNYFMPIWDDLFANGYMPQSLLDVGCGNGVFSVYASRKTGCSLTGIDSSLSSMQEALKRGFIQVCAVNDLNHDRLPFEDGAFDFCLSKDVLEHLVHPMHLIGEINRVLGKSGLLLLHVPNHFPLYGRFKFLFDNSIDTFRYFPGATRWDFPHVRFFIHNELVRIVEDQGFQLVMDMSCQFPVVPFSHRFSCLRHGARYLARRWPSQFAGGFTLLFKKVQ